MKKLSMLLAICLVLGGIGGCSKESKTLVDPNLSKEATEVSTKEETEGKNTEETKDFHKNAEKVIEDFTRDLPKPEDFKRDSIGFDKYINEVYRSGKYINEIYRSPKVDKIQSLLKERYDIDVILAESVLQYENDKIHYLGAKYYAEDDDDVRFRFSISKDKLLKFDFYVSGKEDNFKELKEITNEVSKIMLGKDLANILPQKLKSDGDGNWKHDIDDTYYVMFGDESYSTIDLSENTLSENTGNLAIDSDISYEYFAKTDIKVDYDIQETLKKLWFLPRVHNIKTIEELKKFLGSDTFKIILQNKEKDWGNYYNTKGIKMLGQVTDIYEHEGGVDVTYYVNVNSLHNDGTLEEEMRRLFSKKLFPKAKVSSDGHFDSEGLTAITHIDSDIFKYTVQLTEYYQVD